MLIVSLCRGKQGTGRRKQEPCPSPEEVPLTKISVFIALALWSMLVSGAHAADNQGHPGASTFEPETATFAGGCFWCMQPPFDKLDGVISVTVGYTGGSEKNPTYEQVSSGKTGHAEAIEILFDPSKISYSALLDVFWRNIDPTQSDGQFVDRGRQYRSAIFYQNEEQRRLAEASKEALEKTDIFRANIVTEILPAGPFYPAEEYHQDYYEKNPLRYKYYRYGSGRDGYLEKQWRKVPKE
jgi:methionine-S-sulfoxide reductase